ncbi:putative ribonuclease H-like domain-containing protein [Tanacetum coccineum]|uniref:Ribonuclease H-like domain-containing protein n=1 Tax=Tanacetum coccineum TaxID=301880 RepID=A0ABQ4Y0T4_9ASTR
MGSTTNNINTVSPIVSAADIENNVVDENIVYECIDDPNMPNLEEIVYSGDDEEVGAEADMNNLATTNVTEHVEPKKVIQALTDPSWIEAMQDELQKVWTLVDLPYGKRATGTKWVYRNKKDDRGIVVRNKARLVAQGYTQEEGIDDDEVFALVSRIEAIRLFLAYASFMNFIVYQMDVKSAFLYGIIEEEVYVFQPPGFEDSEFPNKVYKVEKVLYGLHQALRAWYETLSTYLLENRFRRGTIDKTLFIKKEKDDAQEILDEFYGRAHFLLRVIASTPMETNKALLKDEEAANVDVHLYILMIGSLMYLTASRPDIMFVVCACARFQVTPKTSHLHAVKRIFRYLKGHPKLGIWYPRDSSFNLEAFSDSDYASASLDRKSTIGEAEYVAAANCCRHDDKMERVATTDSSLEADQDSGNINRTQSMATLNDSFPQETDSGSGPKCQDTILGGAKAKIRFEAASKLSNDPHLLRVNTLRSREDNMKLKELMEFCNKLFVRALDF